MEDVPRISVVIPTLNEAQGLATLLQYLSKIAGINLIKEIIVVDGGSSESTTTIAKNLGFKVLSSKKGRANQMNHGAKSAKGEILYFLHADTYPPEDFGKLIIGAANDGFEAGCFRMKFDTRNPFLRFFAYLSRINHTLCRGGDQSLFIVKNVFVENGGFDENYLIYEDTEFIRRLYKKYRFKIIPKSVITSARKYREKGWLRVQFHFAIIHLKNYLGAKPDELYNYYQKKLLT